MKPSRRQVLHLTAGAALLPAAFAFADDYPSRPVRIVEGYPPGLTPDIVARLVAQSMSERMGQEFVIDNRPGAGSNLAADLVIHSAADGYTLLGMTITNAVNATLYKNLTFDIVRDVVPVIGTFRSPLVMVINPSMPFRTVPEFLADAKANPGKINYGSPGYGTANVWLASCSGC